MNDKSRENTTIVIWGITAALSFFALMSEGWVIAIPLGVALICTLVIWITGAIEKTAGVGQNNQNYTSEQRGDSAYTMALLMEMMDEDERDEFKSQLKRRILSGETVTDESIIMDMEKRKRG
jgi:ABC-type transport system involved in cytochrome bd biosynthesis fused ATPase/permease subunit